jgi:hypothetical protein
VVGILHEHGLKPPVLKFTNMGYLAGGELHEGRAGQGKATFTKLQTHDWLKIHELTMDMLSRQNFTKTTAPLVELLHEYVDRGKLTFTHGNETISLCFHVHACLSARRV